MGEKKIFSILHRIDDRISDFLLVLNYIWAMVSIIVPVCDKKKEKRKRKQKWFSQKFLLEILSAGCDENMRNIT